MPWLRTTNPSVSSKSWSRPDLVEARSGELKLLEADVDVDDLRSMLMIDTKIAVDIRSALREGFRNLLEAEVPSHTLSAELLLMHVTGKDRTWLYAHCDELLDRAATDQYIELVQRRSEGIPTQYLTGKQEFWGLEFEVSPAVLIPRPETEHVVEVALARLGCSHKKPNCADDARLRADGAGLTIVDVGTGSGCIAIALAKELPSANFYATDISLAALEVARRNASRHGVLDRIQWVECNLLDGIFRPSHSAAAADERPECETTKLSIDLGIDLIISNPPYIPRAEKDHLQREVRDHEPGMALYAGDQGTDIYEPLIRDSAARLNAGGILVLELGYNSLPVVRPLLENSSWTNVAVTNDLAGVPRVLAAERL